MGSSIVGNYLLENGLITYEQLNDLMKEQRRTRVKLGLIAVAEGLLMPEEAERINNLQSVMDMRFGDIAVEKGYLTEWEVEGLLAKQGNAYLVFAQALENQQLMSIEQLEMYMMDFQREHQLTIADIEDIKSDDVDRILPLYIPANSDSYLNVAGTALRTIMRCVDSDTYLDQAYRTKQYRECHCALQYVEGEYSYTCGIAGEDEAILMVASIFGKEEFQKVDRDALDAVGELVNCINGLYTSSLSRGGVSSQLCPPELLVEEGDIASENMMIIPLHIKGHKVDLIIAMDDRIQARQ